jgi:hypothetical protein
MTPAAAASSGAGAYDLTDLATMKVELDISVGKYDSLLRRYISSASAAAAQYCNRVFVAETVKDEFWFDRDPMPRAVRGNVAPLQLSRFPVIELDAGNVVENGTVLVDGTDFRSDLKLGQLTRLDLDAWPRRWLALAISVQYTAGFAVIPAEVADAAARMVKARWFARGRDPMLRQESIPGVRDVSYWIATGEDAGNMSPDVTDILDNYRVPVIG